MTAAQMQAAEELVLAALCQGVDDASVWPEFQSRLPAYRFSDPVRQLIFEAAFSIDERGCGISRERLQHALVMARFPALDVDPYFTPHGATRMQVLDAMSELAAVPAETTSARQRPGDQT